MGKVMDIDEQDLTGRVIEGYVSNLTGKVIDLEACGQEKELEIRIFSQRLQKYVMLSCRFC